MLRKGQFVMANLLSLGGVQREVDAAIVELHPAPAKAPARPTGTTRKAAGS